MGNFSPRGYNNIIGNFRLVLEVGSASWALKLKYPITLLFSKNRHGRFRCSDLFRWFLNEVLRCGMALNSREGEGASVRVSFKWVS